jgi:peptidoglycan hydrolase CwlO-like protein
LSNDILQKDSQITKLARIVEERQQEINRLNKEIENVKTELSNTVVKLQAGSTSSGAAAK